MKTIPKAAGVAVEATTAPTGDNACSARQRLLECAAEAFSRQGYAGASVAAIAQKADISKSTVFHHFPSKQALYLAVIEAAALDFAQTLESLLDGAGSLDRRLSDFQCQHIDHIMTNRQVTHLVLRELQKPDSSGAVHLVRDVLSGNFQRLVQFIEQAQENGLIKSSVEASVAALTLISANVFFFQHHKVLKHLPNFHYANDPKQYAQSVAKLIFHGLDGDVSK